MPPATCNLIADRARLPYGGGSVVISVLQTNVAPIDHYYVHSVEGQTQTLTIKETTVLDGSVANAAGENACSPVTVEVLPPPPPAPTCIIALTPSTLPATGGDVAAAVSVIGSAESVRVNGVDGVTQTVHVTANQILEAVVTNASGSNKCSAAVSVAASSPGAPTCTIAADVSSLPLGGGPVKLTLTGIGDFTKGAINAIDGMTLSETITQSKTYQGIVTGPAGSNSCSTVVQVATPAVQAPSCTLTAITSTLPAGGGNVTLTLNGVGKVDGATIDSAAGLSLVRTLTASKQFNATVTNAGGSSSCSTFVTVASPGFCVHGGGGRVIEITTSEAEANACRDAANASPYASPGGVNCTGDPALKVAVGRCDSLAKFAIWKHKSVIDAGKCVRYNPLSCYQNAKVYMMP